MNNLLYKVLEEWRQGWGDTGKEILLFTFNSSCTT